DLLYGLNAWRLDSTAEVAEDSAEGSQLDRNGAAIISFLDRKSIQVLLINSGRSKGYAPLEIDRELTCTTRWRRFGCGAEFFCSRCSHAVSRADARGGSEAQRPGAIRFCD